MFQLILTVMAIALTALVAVATVNYLPYWYKSASDTETMLQTALLKLESAYDVVTRAANGTPPDVVAAADGGLEQAFGSVLKFSPGAPTGYTWVYGKHADDGTRWANLNYFCLTPAAGSAGASEGIYKGMARMRGLYSSQQLVINTTCGATNSLTEAPAGYPANRSLTLFVAYVPGLDD